MTLLRSRKRLWVLGGLGLLALVLIAILSGMIRTKRMITDLRVREIFAGKGPTMTADEFFAWIDWMRRKRPMSIEETESLLGVRFRRLTPSEDFLRTDAEALKWQAPNYLEFLDQQGRKNQIGVVEWPSGPWKEIHFFRYEPSDDVPAFIDFSLRREVIRVFKKEMIRLLGHAGVQWNPPVENIYATGPDRFPQGLVPKEYWWVYPRHKDEVTFFFDDHSMHDVLHDELPLRAGQIELRLKAKEKHW